MPKKIASGKRRDQLPKRPAHKPIDLGPQLLMEAEHVLKAQHLARILACLERLSEEDLWWRPNASSNSAGNLVLHLAGNVRQWIVSGLGGEPDIRNRDREFAEQGPIPRRILGALLKKEVKAACRILDTLTTDDLVKFYSIQKFNIQGFIAVSHVVEHFAFHSGQIIYLTKLRLGEDLGFTRLPGEKKRKAQNLPAV
ncbi:MAG: DinB family protein [Terriglobia bacterium]